MGARHLGLYIGAALGGMHLGYALHREPVVVTTTLQLRTLFPIGFEVEELAAPTSAAPELGVNIVEIEPNIGDMENTLLLTKQVLTDTDMNFIGKKDVHQIVVRGACCHNRIPLWVWMRGLGVSRAAGRWSGPRHLRRHFKKGQY